MCVVSITWLGNQVTCDGTTVCVIYNVIVFFFFFSSIFSISFTLHFHSLFPSLSPCIGHVYCVCRSLLSPVHHHSSRIVLCILLWVYFKHKFDSPYCFIFIRPLVWTRRATSYMVCCVFHFSLCAICCHTSAALIQCHRKQKLRK